MPGTLHQLARSSQAARSTRNNAHALTILLFRVRSQCADVLWHYRKQHRRRSRRSLARLSRCTPEIPGRSGVTSLSTTASAGRFLREPFGGQTAGTRTLPTQNREVITPTSGQTGAESSWSAAEAAANPSDACNGTLIVPGKNSLRRTRSAYLATLGITLPLSNGTPGPNGPWSQENNHSIAPRVGIAWDVLAMEKSRCVQAEVNSIQRGTGRPCRKSCPNRAFVIGINTNRSLDAASALGKSFGHAECETRPLAAIFRLVAVERLSRTAAGSQYHSANRIRSQCRRSSHIDV